MALDSLQWFLFSANKLPFYIDDNGHIVEGNENYQRANGQSAKIIYAPDGWLDTLVKYARNIKWWGVFRDFTQPLKFTKDGALILANQNWKFGYEAEVYLGMAKLDRMYSPYRYKSWYMSELNFVSYKETDTTVEIPALEGGISKYLKANEGTPYQIPLDSKAQAAPVYIDGSELENKAQFFVSDGAGNPLDDTANLGNHLIDIQIISKEITDIGGVFDVSREKVLAQNVKNTHHYFFKATADTHLDFDWNFIIHIAKTNLTSFYPPNMFIVVRSIATNGVATDLVLLHKTNAGDDYLNGDIGSTYIVNGAGSLDVSNGDELYFYAYVDDDSGTGQGEISWQYSGDKPVLNVQYAFRYAPTHALTITPLRLCELLLDKMTFDTLNNKSRTQYTVKSNFLQQISRTIRIASGDSLREIDGSFITISFDDFFKAMNRWGIGLGIEGETLVIEQLPYFFSQNVIVDLGEVTKCQIATADDLLFNTIKAGYKAQEYKEVNGKDEVNQGQVWQTSNVKVNAKELDLSSPIRADVLGIEVMRINYSQKKTTDTAGDNDSFFLFVTKQSSAASLQATFIHDSVFKDHVILRNAVEYISKFTIGNTINISGTQLNNGQYYISNMLRIVNTNDLSIWIAPGQTFKNEVGIVADFEILAYTLNRPNYTLITGVNRPNTIYNIELSPKRAILNNGALIRSCMYKQDLQRITLQSSDKNNNLVTTLAGVTISENAAIRVLELAAPLFQPYYIEFTVKTPHNLLEQLAVNPYGKVAFSVRGNVFFGYLMDGGIKPAALDVQQFKLLSAPENDLSLMYKQK